MVACPAPHAALAGYIERLERRKVRVRLIGIDPGIRLLFSGHAADGYRCSMSSCESDTFAGLEAQSTKLKRLRELIPQPRLPRVRRCDAGVFANYAATVLSSLPSILKLYGHEDLAHAKLTVRDVNGFCRRSRAALA